MKFPQFTGTDFRIMFGILIPYVVVLNSILYGSRLFISPFIFIMVLATSLLIKCIAWQFHTLVAVNLRSALPAEAQIMKRIGLALVCFFLMTGATNSLITYLYAREGFLGFNFDLERYLWALVSGVVLNIFTTLVYEGTANFEKWKMTLTDTERLKTEYAKSQLEGLKSQLKPHFLFNSINTLSALIVEDPARAEIFLDEMCRVFRYLLRSHDQFISLEEEMEFLRSYFYIIKARYGEGIRITLEMDNHSLSGQIPPFTLQLLMENILHHNIISRSRPLEIQLKSTKGILQISNTTAPKVSPSLDSDGYAMASTLNKFRLLGLEELTFTNDNGLNRITIPLAGKPLTDAKH